MAGSRVSTKSERAIEKLSPDQKKYLLRRLDEHESPSIYDHPERKPAEITAAEKLVQRWNNQKSRDAYQRRKKFYAEKERVLEIIHGSDYAFALKALKAFEKMKF
jgi:hypothetical protein